MTDEFLNGFRVLACVEHIGHNRMPEIVQPHPLQADLLRRLLKVMGTQIRRQHLPGVVDAQIRDLDFAKCPSTFFWKQFWCFGL